MINENERKVLIAIASDECNAVNGDISEIESISDTTTWIDTFAWAKTTGLTVNQIKGYMADLKKKGMIGLYPEDTVGLTTEGLRLL